MPVVNRSFDRRDGPMSFIFRATLESVLLRDVSMKKSKDLICNCL